MSAHHCHAIGCMIPCPPEYLLCPKHWAQVPEYFKQAVYRYYREGQCQDKRPSREWLLAAYGAIYAVAGKEGTMTPDEIVTRYRELGESLKGMKETA